MRNDASSSPSPSLSPSPASGTDGSAPGEGDEHGVPDRPPRHISRRLVIDLVVVLVIIAIIVVAVVHSTGAGGTSAKKTARPTPTLVPTTLYQANWSQGTDGWALPAGWHINSGQITVDGGYGLVAIPYVVTARQYTVEVDFDVTSAPVGGNDAYIGLYANDAGGARLYDAWLECKYQGNECRGYAQLFASQPGDGSNPIAASSDFTSGSGVKAYRVVVVDETVDFCRAGSCGGFAISAVPLAPAHLIFYVHNAQVTVTRFVITTP